MEERLKEIDIISQRAFTWGNFPQKNHTVDYNKVTTPQERKEARSSSKPPQLPLSVIDRNVELIELTNEWNVAGINVIMSTLIYVTFNIMNTPIS